MNKLICFASEFSLMPSRLVFQQRPEKPSEKPAEQHELTKKQAEKMMQAIRDAAVKMNKYELLGGPERGGAFEHEEGEFVYSINCGEMYKDSDMGVVEAHVLDVNKSKKGGIFDSGDDYIGTLRIKYTKDIYGSFKLTMAYQPEDERTENLGGEEKEMGKAEFKDGKYTESNGAILKEKADKFLKIVNDYIRANTPKTPGPKEIRDF